jgi:hypothetical protein
MARRLWATAVALAAMPASVASQSSPAPDYASAYNYALRCYVVILSNGDRAKARPAFDAALRLGQLQGFTNARINVDLDWAISREAQNMRSDSAYKARTLATCRQLGWAS